MPFFIFALTLHALALGALDADADDVTLNVQRDLVLLDAGQVSLELVRVRGLLNVESYRARPFLSSKRTK